MGGKIGRSGKPADALSGKMEGALPFASLLFIDEPEPLPDEGRVRLAGHLFELPKEFHLLGPETCVNVAFSDTLHLHR